MSSSKPPDRGGSPFVSGEVTASARRAQPRSVASLLNDEPSDHSDLASVDDGDVVDASSEDPGIMSLALPEASSPGEANVPPGRDTGSTEIARGKARQAVGGQSLPGPLVSGEEDDADSTAKRHLPDDGALPDKERGFGPYTLLRRLAFGGMGEVFLARRDAQIDGPGSRAGLARLVVIKRILGHMRRDEKHRQMFVDEARVQTLLQSSHIVQIHDVGEIDGQVFLAMEHVHGPSWRGLIDRCRKLKQHIPVAYVVDMMIHAAEGLSYAHNLHDASSGSALRIVHRDVNPHNILVTYDSVVKVIDFGIAKSELREQQTETGTIKGKFAYMSPEQSAAEPLDARSDLFALGICLYELLTLMNPFKKGNIVLSLEAIQKSDPKPLSALRPGAAFLGPIVERMLRKNPDDRFADCADVAAALRQLQQDGLVPEPKQPLATWLREVFAGEIASHLRVLNQTGSDVDVAVSGAHLRQTGSFSAPFSPPSSAGRTSLPAMPAVSVLDDVVPLPASLLPEGHGTGPTGALQLAPRRTLPLLAASVGVVVVVGVIVLGGWQLWRNNRSDNSSNQVVADAGVAVAVVPVVEPVVEPVVVVVDAGVAAQQDLPIADAGVAVAVVDAEPDPVIRKVERKPKDRDKQPVDKIEKVEKVEKVEKIEKVVDVVGKVAVSAEGFVIKGPRTVGLKSPAVLVVDDADAPFKLKMRISVNDAGVPSLSIESEPWAIVRVDQVGRGKTPVTSVVLVPGKKTSLALSNPSGAQMDVAVTFAAKL
ncbi:MAG: serine/threonine-protein kinase [Deltaproteobacteria bacterium]|nr:serine/threonine-protein kinase [Deltaproteobacteria bacterium]